jgi:hypothetical protein
MLRDKPADVTATSSSSAEASHKIARHDCVAMNRPATPADQQACLPRRNAPEGEAGWWALAGLLLLAIPLMPKFFAWLDSDPEPVML